jgi:hypothetical protein
VVIIVFVQTSIPTQKPPRSLVLIIVIVVLILVTSTMLPSGFFTWLWNRLNIFATVFLGIFIEAVPYLLLGTLASGLVEMFLDRGQMNRWISHRPIPAAISGALMGLIFPVCECGVVPLTRRLFHKGLPLSAGIAFLLAAPVLNPIVILSTAAAFGWKAMLFWRVGLSLVIAVVVGLVFSVEEDATQVLRPVLTDDHQHEQPKTFVEKIRAAFVITADEFFEMGRYWSPFRCRAANIYSAISVAGNWEWAGSFRVGDAWPGNVAFHLFHSGCICGAGICGHL